MPDHPALIWCSSGIYICLFAPSSPTSSICWLHPDAAERGVRAHLRADAGEDLHEQDRGGVPAEEPRSHLRGPSQQDRGVTADESRSVGGVVLVGVFMLNPSSAPPDHSAPCWPQLQLLHGGHAAAPRPVCGGAGGELRRGGRLGRAAHHRHAVHEGPDQAGWSHAGKEVWPRAAAGQRRELCILFSFLLWFFCVVFLCSSPLVLPKCLTLLWHFLMQHAAVLVGRPRCQCILSLYGAVSVWRIRGHMDKDLSEFTLVFCPHWFCFTLGEICFNSKFLLNYKFRITSSVLDTAASPSLQALLIYLRLIHLQSTFKTTRLTKLKYRI